MAAAPEKLHQPCAGGASSPTPTMRIRDTALVLPSSAGTAPPETSLPLTFFDIFWLHAAPVQRLLFYRLSSDADVDAIVASLKGALSQAVAAFYPLAGRLWLTPGTANRYEIHYCPGDAVAFTVAEYDGDDDGFDRLAADEPREVAALAPLAPPLPEGGAVLAVQATLLPARGIVLGVTVHHAACDGAGSTNFLHTWAAAACSAAPPPPPPPVIDRTRISDPGGLYDAFCPTASATADETAKMPDDPGFTKMPDDQRLATFTLSRGHLQRVKGAVAAEAAARGVAPPPRCSSLVAAVAFVWSCYQRAKPRGGGGAAQTYLLLTVDHRSRMKPPLPDTYLGNCVGGALAAAPTSEVAEAGAGGLLAACAALAAGIEEAVGGTVTETMGLLAKRIAEAAATGMLVVAGSPRFRVYELDMGFGRPAKVDMVSVVKTGAVAVAESRAGDGGVEVGVPLPPEAMDAFRKCFADAVAALDQEDAGAQ